VYSLGAEAANFRVIQPKRNKVVAQYVRLSYTRDEIANARYYQNSSLNSLSLYYNEKETDKFFKGMQVMGMANPTTQGEPTKFHAEGNVIGCKVEADYEQYFKMSAQITVYKNGATREELEECMAEFFVNPDYAEILSPLFLVHTHLNMIRDERTIQYKKMRTQTPE